MDKQSLNYYKYHPYSEVPEKSYYDKDLEGAAPFLYSDVPERSNENKDRKGDE